MLGSGRDKIETKEQMESSMKVYFSDFRWYVGVTFQMNLYRCDRSFCRYLSW